MRMAQLGRPGRALPFQERSALTCSRIYATISAVPDSPDYRTDKSESTEGGRIASNRWASFHYRLEEDVVAEAFSSPNQSMEDLDPEMRDAIAADSLERSELIGFWVAWHMAGGFDNLERGGWHRATIFRKVRSFRTVFGVHPDEYAFPWVALDLPAAWTDQLNRRIEESRSSGFFS
jgi:hypothetical protein